jgi:hypothetical protein
MKASFTRGWLGAIVLFGALTLVAACSGTTPSAGALSPTGPSSMSGGAVLSPFEGGGSPPPDPCLAPASLGVSNNPPPPDPVCDGRFTGGGFQLNGDFKVTRGFTIHCDNVLSNNLEINWPDGNNFHMEKNSQVSTLCTRPFAPNPPNAPVSRIEVSSAAGTLNKLPASIYFVLEDRGEPGTADRAYFQITQGASVFTFGGNPATPNLIDGGNIQAHFDQPHGPNK